MSGTALLGVSAGALVIGGVVSALTTHVDGTRDVRSRHSNDYQLQPTSREAAKKSIDFQRTMGGLSIVGGGILAGVGSLGIMGRVRPELAIMGAALTGAGIGRLLRLIGAEDKIPKDLPEATAAGQPEMRRRNIMAWANDGAGYSASGIYSGAWSGEGLIADGVKLSPGMQPIVTPMLNNPMLGATESLRGFVLPSAHGGAVPIANAPAPNWQAWPAAPGS